MAASILRAARFIHTCFISLNRRRRRTKMPDGSKATWHFVSKSLPRGQPDNFQTDTASATIVLIDGIVAHDDEALSHANEDGEISMPAAIDIISFISMPVLRRN